MQKFSKQPYFLLASLLSLATAVPTPLTVQATTFLGNSLDNSLPNSNLTTVIPNDFLIRPSLPLDEPVLNPRDTLLLTLHALASLALLNFYEEQQSQTWQSLQHVSIDIVGPLKVVESALAARKYAMWGIYKAVHLMVATNDFRPRNYALYWQGAVVGYVSFNDGARGALGVGSRSANATGAAVQSEDLSLSPTTLPQPTTPSNPTSPQITLSYELKGRTIGEPNVFLTLFTGILKAAPYYESEQVDEFLVNTRTFNTYLSFKGREDLAPGAPFLEYAHLLRLFAQLPMWMLEHGGGWTEANMVVSVDGNVVGAGVLNWQERRTGDVVSL